MASLVANTDDLISILDRILDKGIVVDSWVRLTLQGAELWAADSTARVESAAVHLGYGEQGSWKEVKKTEKPFPYWRRELWSK